MRTRVRDRSRAEPSGSTAAVAELAIASVNARGTFATTAATPASAVLNSPIRVRRTGYKMDAGDAAPVANARWEETIWLTKRRVTPGGIESVNGYSGNEVAWSKVVMQNDDFPNQVGATNSSTRTGPKIEVRWITPGFGVVGNTLSPLRVSINSPYKRDALPAAAVAFVVSDGTTALRFYTRNPVQWFGHGVTGFRAHVWEVINADISALNSGRITVDWEIYGHYGQLVTSIGDARNAQDYFHGTLYFLKNVAMATSPLYVYIRPGSAAASPQASQDAAVARANPYGTWQAARDAVRNTNNSTFSIGAACLDGVVVRPMDTGTNGNVITGLTLSGPTVCLVAGFTVEPDPLGTWTGGSILESFPSQIGGSTNPDASIGFTIQNWTMLRRPSGISTPYPNAVAGSIKQYFIAPPGGGTFDFGGTGMSSITSNSYSFFYGYTFTNMANSQYLNEQPTHGIGGLFDAVVNDNFNRQLPAHCLICVRAFGVGRVDNLATDRSMFMDAVYTEQAASNTGVIFGTAGSTTFPAMVRNWVGICLNSTEANRFGLSSDGQTYSMSDVCFDHVTVPALARNNRGNAFYVDGAPGAASARDHRYCVIANSVIPPLACKGDLFGNAAVPDAAREPGWSEFGYSIGSDGNFYPTVWGTVAPGDESETARFFGQVVRFSLSVGARGNGPYANPGYLDPRVPIVVGGTNGTPGGDYRHTYSHSTPAQATVLFDITGAAVPLNCVRPGAHSGYGL